MPIQLQDLTTATSVQIFSPKFFDNKLTGAGKKIGLLNEFRNPVNIPKTQVTTNDNINCRKHKYVNGKSDVSFIPLYVLTPDAWSMIKEQPLPEQHELHEIAVSQDKKTKAFVSMKVHSIVLEEIAADFANGPTKKNLTACYQPTLWFIMDGNTVMPVAEDLYAISSYSRVKNSGHQFYTEFTCNPRQWMERAFDELTKLQFTVDTNAGIDYINTYELYANVVKRSEEWQTTIDKMLDMYFEQAVKNSMGPTTLNEVARILRHIEDYNVPLNLYRHIFDSVMKHFPADEASVLCKQNLNLLLSATLNNLNINKAQLTCVPTVTPEPTMDPLYSREQAKAISTKAPLALVQAGAGTGKSTVILARIQYMIACGINPQDITVLSFTNAAANHITDKNPHVHSMTIARMIHQIYTNNFQNHELSSIDTIINSLDIYYPDDDFAATFRKKLRSVAKNDRDAFTSMNNFIEKYYDEVIKILDTIKQTSLELEIIICYQKIDTLTEPTDVQSNYLIIDEVQDNSIFEFIYTLKYVEKHKESLFMVGDCSQTLYEFRASNPKALNVLEGSGVFDTYQLQTNYRSNQEILDFANVALSDIEANQYANIQLQANSLAPVTEQSFTDKVTLHYEQLRRISEFNDALSSLFAIHVCKFIDAKIAAGEQVAFLAYTRNHIYKMEEILKRHYPNLNIVNLVPDRMFNSTVFSEFIKKYWSEVKFAPTHSIMNTITQEINYRLQFLVRDVQRSQGQIQALLQSWVQENRAVVDAWQAQHMNGVLTLDQFLNNVRENMLQFEIKRNAVRQSLLSARNQENKQNNAVANANLILSTIHSAKGLEFENTVVIYQAKNDMDEEKKRMYYVALTRAMKSEFILAYDTVVNPKIQGDYDTIVEALHNKTINQNIAAMQNVAQVQPDLPPDNPDTNA